MLCVLGLISAAPNILPQTLRLPGKPSIEILCQIHKCSSFKDYTLCFFMFFTSCLCVCCLCLSVCACIVLTTLACHKGKSPRSL